MSSPALQAAQMGDLNALIYDYEKPGDILPMHNHDEATAHIVIVAKGSVVLLVLDPADGQVNSAHYEAGAIVDTLAGFPHSIVGVTPKSRTIHIRKKMQAAVDAPAPPAPPADPGR